MKKRTKHNLSLLVIICLVILIISLTVTGLVSILNYDRYLDAVYETESGQLDNIALMISNSLNTSEWRSIAEKADDYTYGLISDKELEEIAESDAYTSTYQKLQQVTDSFSLENASIFNIDQDLISDITEENFTPEDSCFLTFIMDCYPKDSGHVYYELGEIDSWWEDYEGYIGYRDNLLEAVESRKSIALQEYLEDGTVLLTSYFPVFDSDECVVMIAVSRNQGEIRTFVSSFFWSTLLIGMGITLILCAFSILLFHLRIVKPLRMIRGEAEQFIANNTQVSEKLSTVRTRDEIQSLSQSFLKMEQNIRDYVTDIELVTAEKEHIRTELNVAAHIQEDMLPRIFPPYPDRKEFSIFASMDPAKEVGGDFYDFFFVDDDHLALVIADVSGKGVPASLFMVIAKTLIKTRTLMGGAPAQILSDVNKQLCEGNESEMFVTVWLAIIDLNTGKGVAANAGHEHPVLCRKGADYELVINRHSPAVATLDTIRFREHEFELYPGDRVFVYSDGLPEATNLHDELYGTQRMLDALNRNRNTQLSELLPSMARDVEQFVGEAPQFDDLTMLAFEYNGKQ